MIFIVEPICKGNEHAIVNAGLAASLNYSFPDSSISFSADESQVVIVKEILQNENVNNVVYHLVALPSSSNILAKKIYIEYRFLSRMLRNAVNEKARFVIFSACTSTQILCLKILLRLSFRSLTVISIIHSELQGILMRPPRKPWCHLIWLRNVLRFKNLKRLKIIVPGEALLPVVFNEIPTLKGYAYALNLAYFFSDHSLDTEYQIPDIVKFGFIGVGTKRKGIDTFFRLAQITKMTSDSYSRIAEFKVIGSISYKNFPELTNSVVSFFSSGSMLPRSEMNQLIMALDYIVLPYDKEEYKLVASATLLDAFEFVKPIIAFRNPTVEYCFSTMGDIGFLCDTEEEMATIILNIVNNSLISRYSEQCKNILNGRKIFDPNYLAPKLKCIMDQEV
jgi:glycosyltransferase involved in cell wall biosynthesis